VKNIVRSGRVQETRTACLRFSIACLNQGRGCHDFYSTSCAIAARIEPHYERRLRDLPDDPRPPPADKGLSYQVDRQARSALTCERRQIETIKAALSGRLRRRAEHRGKSTRARVARDDLQPIKPGLDGVLAVTDFPDSLQVADTVRPTTAA